MKNRMLALSIAFLLMLGLAACNNEKRAGNKLDKDQVRAALDKAGFNDVNFDIDNDKGVVTLKGDAKDQATKDQVEQVAKSASAGYVVSNQLGVRPPGEESASKKVESNLDDAIKSDWKALEAKMHWENQHINADVKNGVLTLKGDVDTDSQRTTVEKTAAKIPNVQQVVNELEVKSAKRKGAAPTSARE